jgi:hypothetical protein
MVNFEITRKETCPSCSGQKKVANPEWDAFWSAYRLFKDVNGREMTMDEEQEWWDDHNYFGREPGTQPPEEEWCGECEGEGILTKTVDLLDALKELGILKQLESLKSSVSYASNVAGCLANGIIPD